MSKELISALEKALRDDPQLKERTAADISEELVQSGYLQQVPLPSQVAEELATINMRERGGEHE